MSSTFQKLMIYFFLNLKTKRLGQCGNYQGCKQLVEKSSSLSAMEGKFLQFQEIFGIWSVHFSTFITWASVNGKKICTVLDFESILSTWKWITYYTSLKLLQMEEGFLVLNFGLFLEESQRSSQAGCEEWTGLSGHWKRLLMI